MKFLGRLVLWVIIILGSTFLVFLIYSYIKGANFHSIEGIVSPLPKYLTNSFDKKAQANSFWQPKIPSKIYNTQGFELTAQAAISYDITSDTLLFTKNIEQKLPIASLTKIMTSVIALENMKLKDKLTVTKSAAQIGEDSMGLTEGEKLTLEQLLYGLILNSGNDAAEVIAQKSPMGRSNFLDLMNKKAEEMGLSATRFTNPTGLQGDGNQYSSAKELLVLTHYALQNEEFARITSTYEYDIDQNSDHKAYQLFNETNLLTTYPGVKGVKTGFTDEAGMCLVTYLDYKGHKIIAVLLHSDNRRQEMKELLDYSLKNLGVTPPTHG